MIEQLENIDQKLLLLINGVNSPFFDQLMWAISDSFFGIPFYIVFYLIAFKFFGWKKALVIVLLGGVSVGLADLSSKYLFKEVFLRYRPSHNFLLKDKIHLVNNYRGGMYGFVSSHSANMFAIAISLGAFFYKENKVLIYLMLIWAGIIAYSRMYLGVHYPSDVFVGGLLGGTIGFVVYKLSHKLVLR